MDWETPHLRLCSQNTQVRVSMNHFAKGAMREARCMYDKRTDCKGVAKVYYTFLPSKELLLRDMEAQALAKFLALEYSACNKTDVPVDFLTTSVYEFPDLPEGHPMKYFAYEPYIEGEYRKYTNNTDFVSSDFGTAAQTFSHFTWQFTHGNLIVVDLQGVNFILTDPQIHCKDDRKFGAGNLGTEGMAAFFSSHNCNDSCRKLGLVPVISEGTKVAESNVEKAEALIERLAIKDSLCLYRRKKEDTYSMALSCVLCGALHNIIKSEFLELHNSGREVMCKKCIVKVENKSEKRCSASGCDHVVLSSDYWYLMKGMETPNTCRDCKDKAKRSSRRAGADSSM